VYSIITVIAAAVIVAECSKTAVSSSSYSSNSRGSRSSSDSNNDTVRLRVIATCIVRATALVTTKERPKHGLSSCKSALQAI
jgi:hypothetical protein